MGMVVAPRDSIDFGGQPPTFCASWITIRRRCGYWKSRSRYSLWSTKLNGSKASRRSGSTNTTGAGMHLLLRGLSRCRHRLGPVQSPPQLRRGTRSSYLPFLLFQTAPEAGDLSRWMIKAATTNHSISPECGVAVSSRFLQNLTMGVPAYLGRETSSCRHKNLYDGVFCLCSGGWASATSNIFVAPPGRM